ncbi:hypothetical protein AALO_G00206190 [Alosa alosa]|uniref:Uncharacterized protein n=1 Tax=Alosa alosa TaxID=278164 RepID=A0AAV6G7E3_9TELE|nr:hypothetical protein AALO_G00206190 [Alosa alosa]
MYSNCCFIFLGAIQQVPAWSQRLALHVRWGRIYVRHQKGDLSKKERASADSVAIRHLTFTESLFWFVLDELEWWAQKCCRWVKHSHTHTTTLVDL